jgi:flagellar protein FlaI
MEKIREKVRRFLTEFKSPQEKDIKDFLSYIALGNPSLDRDSFRTSVLKAIEQRDILKAYEIEILSLARDSPVFAELEGAFKEAKEGHDNLEDVDDELNYIKKILTSLKIATKSEEPAAKKPSEILKTEVTPQVERAEVAKPAEIKPSEILKTEVTPQVEHAEVAKPAEIKPSEIPKTEVMPQVERVEVAKPADIQQEEIAGGELEEIPEEIEEEIASLKEVLGEESKPESKEEVKISEPEKIGEVKITEPEKKEEFKISDSKKIEEINISALVTQGQPGSAEAIMRRLNMDNTKTILKDNMTPEKQAVFELLEEKLMSDVETRIKKLKEMQTKVLEEEEKPKSFVNKISKFFTKEMETIDAYDPSLHGPLVTFEGLEGFNEIERYWVNEPYCFVVILFDPENNIHLYYAAEPVLSEFEDLFLKEIKDRLKDVLLVETVQREGDKKKILTSKVIELIKDYALDISPLTLEKVLYYSRRDFIYFGKIDPLMHDNRIEDVSSNGFDIPIYLYHKKYTNIPTNIYYKENDLNSYVIRLAQRCGKHISVAEPMVDATMPDGSRIQMTLGTEVTSRGSTFTIRKFSEVPITPVDLINWNTFSAEEMAYLWTCIENNKSLIFAGGTASGKTSSLNAVSLFIPPQAKIVTLEDTRELKLPHPNWIPGVTRASFTPDGRGGIDMYELLRAALRQRPEFLLVGEVRGKEALTLFQAMSTGHTTFSTMHADSVASAIHRLENPPISVPRTMIQALDIISIQSQTYIGGKRARRNMKLVEITDIDPTTRNIRTNDIFIWDALTDKFLRVGESKALNDIMVRRGWSLSQLKKELSNRQKILEFMVNNKIADFNAISTIIHDYQSTPEKVINKLKITDK